MRGDVFLCLLFVRLHSGLKDCPRGGGRGNLNSRHGACRRGLLRCRGVILGRSHMKRRAPYYGRHHRKFAQLRDRRL
ncbi:hypothetical protein EDB83DRAFT_2425444 [Lactarius deliciosus]|nr:hypothetical protein EDB83DRAFT_2425444 [Lactarius deliciosus]